MFHLFVCFLFVTPTIRWKVLKLAVPSPSQSWLFHGNWKWPTIVSQRNIRWNLNRFVSTDLCWKDDWSFVLGTMNYILIPRSGKVCVSPTRQPEGRFFAESSVKYAPRLSISWPFLGKLHSRRLFHNYFHIQLDLFPPVMIKSKYCFFCYETIFGMYTFKLGIVLRFCAQFDKPSALFLSRKSIFVT